jgi:hypothetical protein
MGLSGWAPYPGRPHEGRQEKAEGSLWQEGECTMRQQLEQRLKALRVEYESGGKMIAELEAKQTNLRGTLLRISGAIQVLEEELAKEGQGAGNGSGRSSEDAQHVAQAETERAGDSAVMT